MSLTDSIGPTFVTQPRSPGFLCTNTVREIPTRPGASMYPCVLFLSVASPRPEPHVCSSMLESGSSISFQITGDQGAALLTKHPTYREDAELGRALEVYTKENYDSWVKFAHKRGHPNDIKPILVTGVDMTRDFAMMSYSSDGDHLTAEFKTSAPGVTFPWGAWRTAGAVHTNCGPQPCRRPSSAQTAGATFSGNSHAEAVSDEYDQCVFIRYYTVRKRLGIPRVIKAAAGPHDLGPGNRDGGGSPFEMDCGSDEGSDISSSLFDDDGSGDRSSITSIDSESDIVVHNTTPVRSFPTLFALFARSD